MKKSTISLIAIMATLSLSSPVFAASDYQKTSDVNQGRELNVSQSSSLSAEKLLGMTIESKKGEDIGEIQDLKFDPKNGRIDFVTVQVGGVLGIGGKDGVAVPLEAFRFADDKAKLIVDQNKLNDVPNRANLSNEEFRRDLQSHYGISPAWEDKQSSSSSKIHKTDDAASGMNMDKKQHLKMDSNKDTSNTMNSQ